MVTLAKFHRCLQSVVNNVVIYLASVFRVIAQTPIEMSGFCLWKFTTINVTSPLVITFSLQQSLDFIVLSLILFCVWLAHQRDVWNSGLSIHSTDFWAQNSTTNSISYLYILHYFTICDFWVGQKIATILSFYFSQKNVRQVLLAALETLVFSCKNWFHKRIV